jgi:3-phosphoshikimate 1-carboxyvinyltransferase
VPGSKSIAQRALVCAALADGRSRLVRVPPGSDVVDVCAALERAGTLLERLAPAAVVVQGRPPGRTSAWSEGRALDAGESGTGARLLAGALGLCARAGTRWELGARGTLAARKSAPLFAALAHAGVAIEWLGPEHGWPVRLTSIGPPSDLLLERPISSQEASALALACSAWPDEIRIAIEGEIPSRPYLDMTLGILRTFGARVEETREGARVVLTVQGPLCPPEEPLEIEPDASAAAVALAAACLTGGDVRVSGFGTPSLQGDVRIAEHLRAFGVAAGFDGGVLWSRGRATRGARIDLSGEPDLAPPLAAVAAAVALEVGESSELSGLGTLPGKESSRIAVLAEGLERIGVRARSSSERLSIAPGSRREGELVLDPRGDHRMAFAFALLGLLVPGVRVRGPGCVAKSWPGFWEEIERLGAD